MLCASNSCKPRIQIHRWTLKLWLEISLENNFEWVIHTGESVHEWRPLCLEEIRLAWRGEEAADWSCSNAEEEEKRVWPPASFAAVISLELILLHPLSCVSVLPFLHVKVKCCTNGRKRSLGTVTLQTKCRRVSGSCFGRMYECVILFELLEEKKTWWWSRYSCKDGWFSR